MDNFETAAYMFYLILSIIVLAFLIYIAPSLAAELWDAYLQKAWENLVKVEWVERLLLAIEEAREWQTTPGRHRSQTHGVHHPDDTYFLDLGKLWKEVEDTLRVDLTKKEPANV